mmetsp:Transcript_18937/g.48249  ORF Transcript_18937/g.48249 Transcript_18937/m.48249 type:complete len:170 (-) Transcript_18937:3705-4214(-)
MHTAVVVVLALLTLGYACGHEVETVQGRSALCYSSLRSMIGEGVSQYAAGDTDGAISTFESVEDMLLDVKGEDGSDQAEGAIMADSSTFLTSNCDTLGEEDVHRLSALLYFGWAAALEADGEASFALEAYETSISEAAQCSYQMEDVVAWHRDLVLKKGGVVHHSAIFK